MPKGIINRLASAREGADLVPMPRAQIQADICYFALRLRAAGPPHLRALSRDSGVTITIF